MLVMILTLLTPEDVLTHLLALLLRHRGAGLPGDSHTLLLGLSHTLLSAGSKAGVNIVLTAWYTLIGRGLSRLDSHWSRACRAKSMKYCQLRQLSYVMKNQLGNSKTCL